MSEKDGGPSAVLSMFSPRMTLDPDSSVDRAALRDDDVADTIAVLDAMNRWREAERTMSEASRRYMHLGETDMRALRFLLAGERQGRTVTPGTLASHLGVSAAAITKLVDRLTVGGHVVRESIPGDRRSISLRVTPETRVSARATVGRSHARRFDAVASLSPADRSAVRRFFTALMTTAAQPFPDEGD